jgi:hypothetical protein
MQFVGYHRVGCGHHRTLLIASCAVFFRFGRFFRPRTVWPATTAMGSRAFSTGGTNRRSAAYEWKAAREESNSEDSGNEIAKSQHCVTVCSNILWVKNSLTNTVKLSD